MTLQRTEGSLRRGAAQGAAGWLAGLVVCAGAAAQPAPFSLPPAGCPMAHCDARMSDQVRHRVPSVGSLVHLDQATSGGGGLGCVSNLSLVACTYRGDPALQSNLVVYDAAGRRVWEDHGLMGSTAWTSAPMIGTDGSVIAADRDRVLRVDPVAGQVLWNSPKPDAGVPISPVPVGTGLVFVATTIGDDLPGEAAVTVWDSVTGALLSQRTLVDETTGRTYVTRNTPAVRGNRVYVLAEARADPTDGRLIAVDVCEAEACGGRGATTVRWYYAFKGPSGASPLVIGNRLYFDGRPTRQIGSFVSLVDRGASARLAWLREFPSPMGVSAAQDPRGGMWITLSTASHTLHRLDADTGATLQQVLLDDVLGLGTPHIAQSVLSVFKSATGAVVLVLGSRPADDAAAPTHLMAVDVSTQATGTLLWRFEVATDPALNSAASQFPLVIDAAGRRRVVFNGSKAWTYFVGEP